MNASSPTPRGLPGAEDIPYDRFLDCIHCGLCTSACPTYLETGDENDGPRGRIHLMRAVVDGRIDLNDGVRRHLDLCLDCRSCETACPSGVRYGRLIEPFRVLMHEHDSKARDWFSRYILGGLLADRRRLGTAMTLARWSQRLGIDGLVRRLGLTRWLPIRMQRMHNQLPRLEKPPAALATHYPAIGESRGTVGLFLGCVADAVFRRVHLATVRVLQENGFQVVVPSSQACCGAIDYHSGNGGRLTERITRNADAFRQLNVDAVIMNVAGCGAMLADLPDIVDETMKIGAGSKTVTDEDGRSRLAADAGWLAENAVDIHEFLSRYELVPPPGRLACRVAMQDPCHLQHAQQIRSAPRELLRKIPGLQVLEIDESEICCGAAGSYSMTQPEMADALGNRKVQALQADQPDVVASANAGCSLQLQAHLTEAVPVMHPIELLDLSYRNKGLPGSAGS